MQTAYLREVWIPSWSTDDRLPAFTPLSDAIKQGNKGMGNYQGFTQSCSPAMNKNLNSMTAAKQRERGFAKARSSGEMTRTLITPLCDTLQKRSDERSVFIIETIACFNWENDLDESEVNPDWLLQFCGNYSPLRINVSEPHFLIAITI